MRDLRQRGLQSLSMTLDADAEFQAAIGCHARNGLLEARHHWNAPTGIDRGAVRALLAEDAAAEADTQRAGCFRLSTAHGRKINRGDDAPHAFWIITAVEVFPRNVLE